MYGRVKIAVLINCGFILNTNTSFWMCEPLTPRHSVSCVSLVPVKGGGDCHHQTLPTAVTSSQNTLCAEVTEFSLHFSQFSPLFPGVRHHSSVVRCGTAGVYVGVSFKDSSLSVRPSFLCHTGGFFCFLPHCLLIRLNVSSNLSYLPSVSTESVGRS